MSESDPIVSDMPRGAPAPFGDPVRSLYAIDARYAPPADTTFVPAISDGRRLNRLNYFLLGLALWGVRFAIVFTAMIILGVDSQGADVIDKLMIVPHIIATVFFVRLRLRDMGENPSRWWGLFIPFYNIYFALRLLFTPSSY